MSAQTATDQSENLASPGADSSGLLGSEAISGYYEGRIYVRPMGRGVVMIDRAGMPHLDDVLPEGYYCAKIHVSAIPPLALMLRSGIMPQAKPNA